MTLAERDVAQPTVSLARLLRGDQASITGRSEVSLKQYVDEIPRSGFPGIHGLSARLTRAQLDGHLGRIIDRDFDALGHQVRRPATLRRWMQGYAAATATTASFETIRDAAGGERGEKPTRATTQSYRDVLERLWILDPVPAGGRPETASLDSSLAKHHLADPALAAHLLEVDAEALLRAQPAGPPIPRDGTLVGALFESLVTLCVRVYAQAAEARVGHLRTWSGDRKVDLIVERGAQLLAIEVKLSQVVNDRDIRDLLWLREALGENVTDTIIIITGPAAYRRPDGIAVIPVPLIGP